VLGKNAAATWLQVQTPDQRTGWMDRACLQLTVSLDRVPVAAVRGVAPAPAQGPASQAPLLNGATTPAADMPAITDAPKGLAVVLADHTDLYVAPSARADVVHTLQRDEPVKLLGQAKGAWVRVQPFTAVMPGWVAAGDLRPLPGTIAGSPTLTDTQALSPTATLMPPLVRAPTPSVAPTAPVATAAVEADAPLGDVPTPGPEQAPVEISVAVIEAAAPSKPGQVVSTPALQIGVPGVQVQVVTVFGDVLLEAVTPANGQVTFTRDIPPDTALYVQIPALGLRAQVPADEVAAGTYHLTIAVPPMAP
jgi:hypothetical protein